jgi:hypothetical protein
MYLHPALGKWKSKCRRKDPLDHLGTMIGRWGDDDGELPDCLFGLVSIFSSFRTYGRFLPLNFESHPKVAPCVRVFPHRRRNLPKRQTNLSMTKIVNPAMDAMSGDRVGHGSLYVRLASTPPSRAYRGPVAMTLGLRTHWTASRCSARQKGCIAVTPA